jgi:hypothetical protein
MIGRAAFETAKRMFPKDCLEYRHGAQVLERSYNGRESLQSDRDIRDRNKFEPDSERKKLQGEGLPKAKERFEPNGNLDTKIHSLLVPLFPRANAPSGS